MVHEKVWQDKFQIKTTLDARMIIKTTLDARTRVQIPSSWVVSSFRILPLILHPFHGVIPEDNIVLGADQEDVPDLINDDIGNNPQVPQGIAGLVESICHVG